MADYVAARHGIEACIQALSSCAGINARELAFRWEQLEGMNAPEAGCKPGDKIETVRVLFEKKWSTLVFAASEMDNSADLPGKVLTKHRTEILEALRRLKGLSRPIEDSDCPDRWVSERDAFPGEPI